MADDQTTTVFTTRLGLPVQEDTFIQTTVLSFRLTWAGRTHHFAVLWYFAQSPFQERTSQNQELMTQYGNTPLEGKLLGTKQGWHNQLRIRRGISYVVYFDPVESNTQLDGPHGKEPSNVWVIRKQQRDEPQNDAIIKVLGYYYILNDAIYEAPSLASVLTTRMLNTTTALNNLFSTASELPIFSAAHGHTYRKPIEKPVSPSQPEAERHSKESTPLPTQESSTTDKDPKVGDRAATRPDQDSWILDFALRRTMRHGKEFSDDKPLVGEPGKLRYSTTKEQPGTDSGIKAASSQLSVSRGPTPMYSRAGSTVPK